MELRDDLCSSHSEAFSTLLILNFKFITLRYCLTESQSKKIWSKCSTSFSHIGHIIVECTALFLNIFRIWTLYLPKRNKKNLTFWETSIFQTSLQSVHHIVSCDVVPKVIPSFNIILIVYRMKPCHKIYYLVLGNMHC